MLSIFDTCIEFGGVLVECINHSWEMRFMGVVAAPAIPEMVWASDMRARDGRALRVRDTRNPNWNDRVHRYRVRATREVALMESHGPVVCLDTGTGGHNRDCDKDNLEPAKLRGNYE